MKLVTEQVANANTSDLFQERNKTLRNIDDILRSRQAAMKVKPDDANSATHLLRCALGGTAYGVDHGRLSQVTIGHQNLSAISRLIHIAF